MYDSLLDELEDDVVSNPQEVEELTEKVVDAEEADAELLVDETDVAGIPDADIEAEVEQEVDASGDAEETLIEQVENWSDDPVRMYLREMGGVELLSREGEIEIAKRIESCREMMIGGICESPLTISAIVQWHDALKEFCQIQHHIRIRILLHYQGRRRVLDKNRAQPCRNTSRSHPLRSLARERVQALTARVDFQLVCVKHYV